MRGLFDIAPYAVAEFENGYAVYKDIFRLTDEIDCEADAYGHAHGFLDEDAAQAEIDAAEQAELEAARYGADADEFPTLAAKAA
ncbi:hypothetical protein ACQKQD_18900 [Methylobacterium sp. NPDC080182]|uniref:hypothetical protein n=1 Tax=Methylobacterium sp. NPDC080182 TaxID=3390590 RepID=UPI003D0588F1